MLKPIVSVIVPSFNIEPYISRCLESVAAQTLHEMEIIVVDDGSTDKTGAICDQYSQSDPRVKVIHKKNEGLPEARNAGLKAAKGTYILHVDGDDWIEPALCKNAVAVAVQTSADIVIMDHIRDDGLGKQWLIRDTDISEGRSISPEEYLILLALTKARHSSWAKLFRKTLYAKGAITYPREVVMAEDMATTFRLAMVARKIVKHNGAYYHYRIRPGSLMDTHNYQGRDGYAPINVIREFAHSRPEYSPFIPIVEFHNIYRQFRWNLANKDRMKLNTPPYLVFVDFIANIGSFKYSPYIKRLPRAHRFLILCYSISPKLGNILNNLWLYIVVIGRFLRHRN